MSKEFNNNRMTSDGVIGVNLERFKQAQDLVYHRVVAELEQGLKQSHWIWFIFPQIDGLAQSTVAKKFAIKDQAEARAYLNDGLLSGRLNECCQLLLRVKHKTALEILGYPDELKLRSSMTLFASISEQGSIFHQVIERYYDDQFDFLTLQLLQVE